MKKFFLLAVVVLSLFSAVEQVEACDPWNITVIPLPDCPSCPELEVEICVLCNATYAGFEIEILGYNNVCDDITLDFCLDLTQAYVFANFDVLCPNSWTPCPNTAEITIKTPLCFYRDDESPINIYFCNDSYCKQTWDVCKNGNVVTMTVKDAGTVVGSTCDEYDYWPPDTPFKCARVSCP